MHWLACGLYLSGRKSVLPTADDSSTVRGNCVSLTRLLRASKLRWNIQELYSNLEKLLSFIRGIYRLQKHWIQTVSYSLWVSFHTTMHLKSTSNAYEMINPYFSFILCSLIQFFQKMKKWLDMTNSEEDFRKKIERLNRNFAVVSVIFKKYDNIFFTIFKSPVYLVESAKTHRSRKPRYV